MSLWLSLYSPCRLSKEQAPGTGLAVGVIFL